MGNWAWGLGGGWQPGGTLALDGMEPGKTSSVLAVCGVQGGQERRSLPPLTASMVFLQVVVELGWGAGVVEGWVLMPLVTGDK